jgi:hypothetical protein
MKSSDILADAPEVRSEEMRCYGAHLAFRSPRTPSLANFRFADYTSTG